MAMGSPHAARNIAEVNDILNDLTVQLDLSSKGVGQLTATTQKWNNQLGLVERSYNKLLHWFYGSRLGKLSIVYEQFSRMTFVSGELTQDFRELGRETKRLTIIQRNLLVPFMKILPAVRLASWSFVELDKVVQHSSRPVRWLAFRIHKLVSVFFSFINIIFFFLVVIGLFSLAIEGSDSKLIIMTEDTWLLNDALTGLSGVLQGNTSDLSLWEVSVGGALAFLTVGLLFMRTKWAFAALGIYLFKAAYDYVLDKTGDKTWAWAAGLVAAWNVLLAWVYRGSILTAIQGVMRGLYTYITVTAIPAISVFLRARWRALVVFIRTTAWPWLVNVVRVGGGMLLSGLVTVATSLWTWAIVGAVLFGGWLIGRFDWVVGLVGSFMLAAVVAITVGVGLIPAILIGLGIYILGWIGKNWRKILSVSKKWGIKLISNLKRLGRRFKTWLMLLPVRLVQAFKDHDWAGIGWIIVEALLLPFAYFGTAVYNIFVSAVNALGEIMPKVTVPDWVYGIGGMSFDMGWDPLPYLEMAKGGIVTAPTRALIGEAGPEAVIPLDKIGNMGTTNHITLNISVGGVTDRTDKRALAREISDMLNKEMRRLGGEPTRGRY